MDGPAALHRASSPQLAMPRPRIAVIGSGIGGTSAAWHLCEFSRPRDGSQATVAVDTFEGEAHLGGHAYQVEVDGEAAERL